MGAQWKQAGREANAQKKGQMTAKLVREIMVAAKLGGPDPDDRAVLALATASRHPGVALAIASANFPGQTLVPAAVLWYLIVSALVSIPYLTWRQRRHGGIASAVET